MKFSGKMCFKIILKVTKKPRFHPLYRRYIFQKTTGEIKECKESKLILNLHELAGMWNSVQVYLQRSIFKSRQRIVSIV